MTQPPQNPPPQQPNWPQPNWQPPYGHPQQPGYVPYPPQPLPPPKKKVWPWILLAVVVVLALFAGCAVRVGTAVYSVVDEQAKREIVVTYEVTGDAAVALVTYTGNNSTTEQLAAAALPWRKNVTVTGLVKYASITATNPRPGAGMLTCKIIADGKILTEKTITGAGASASCEQTHFETK